MMGDGVGRRPEFLRLKKSGIFFVEPEGELSTLLSTLLSTSLNSCQQYSAFAYCITSRNHSLADI